MRRMVSFTVQVCERNVEEVQYIHNLLISGCWQMGWTLCIVSNDAMPHSI